MTRWEDRSDWTCLDGDKTYNTPRSLTPAPAGSSGGGVPVPGPETVPGAGAGTTLPPSLASDSDPQSCDSGGGGIFFTFRGDELATCLAALQAHETYLALLQQMARGSHREAVREELRATTILWERLIAAAAGAGVPH